MYNRKKESMTSYRNNKSIWEKVRNVEIQQLIQNFLYHALHHSLRIRDYWDNIPTYKHCTCCSLCQDQTETLEHILLECNSPGRSALWQLAADCWPSELPPWSCITIGTILGYSSLSTTTQQRPNTATLGTSHLLHILISETAHLIWVLHCERAIGGKTTTTQAIKSRWVNKINQRIDIDHHLAEHVKQSKISQRIAHSTWQHLTMPKPRHTIERPIANEVLVGISLPWPSADQGNPVVPSSPTHPADHRVFISAFSPRTSLPAERLLL